MPTLLKYNCTYKAVQTKSAKGSSPYPPTARLASNWCQDFYPHPPCLNISLDFKPISSIFSWTTTFLQTGCMVERYTHTLVATKTCHLIGRLTSIDSEKLIPFPDLWLWKTTDIAPLVILISIVRMNVGLAWLTGACKCQTVQTGFSKRSLEQESQWVSWEDNMFWLILGEENDIYPLTATLSVNALDPHPPNTNLTLTIAVGGYGQLP